MDLNDLMRQAQLMQKQAQEAQARAAQREVVGESGGGLVKVHLTGDMQAKSVTLDPVTLTDAEMLQDLITAAFNDAMRKAKDLVSEELGPMAQMLKSSGLGGF